MINIGIDDTDSKLGMCTTYLAAVLAERLSGFGIVDYPRLFRLNPNIKYKTRGNAALCLVLDAGPEAMDEVERIALAAVNEFSRFDDENTNPGLLLYSGEITDELKAYAVARSPGRGRDRGGGSARPQARHARAQVQERPGHRRRPRGHRAGALRFHLRAARLPHA